MARYRCVGGRPFVALAVAMVLSASSRQRPILAQSVTIPPDVTRVLSRTTGASPDDASALQAERAVVRTAVAPENLEASVVAAVRIHTGLERTVSYFRQLLSYVDGQATMQYGPLLQPISDGDLRDLTLDASDLADLRACAPQRCDIRAGAAGVDAIQSATNWNAPDASDRGAAWLQQTLTNATRDYQRAGDAALRGFDEKGVALDLPTLWQQLEDRSVIPAQVAPELQRYLGRYPGARPGAATSEFYFDKQRFTGLKPITGITHLITWRDPEEPRRVVIAQKQIQATHYFYGALAVTMFVEDGATPPTTYVVYTNTLRGDLLRGTQATSQGGLRGRVSNIGAGVQRRLGDQMVRQSAESLMTNMKAALER